MPEITEILTRMTPGKFDATRAANFDIERAKGVLESSFGIERMVAFDEETRTAEFSFGTDQPIEHWFGMVALDVSKKAVVVDRVKNGVAPFLVNHSRDQHCGVIVKDSLELGPSIRGKAKFSRSQLGEDMFNDVKDEIRVGTSLGFVVHDMELTNEKEVRKGAIPQYRVTKWEILEVSLASIPADIGCGSNRAFEREQPISEPPSPESRAFSTETEKTMPDKTDNTPVTPAVERTAEEITRDRENAIVEWAGIFGDEGTEIARGLLATRSDVTQDDVRMAIKAKRDAAPQIIVPPQNPQDIARNAGIQLATSVYRGGALKSFKGEKAQERAYRAGMFLAAALGDDEKARTFCRENGIAINRAHGGGTNALGGILVPEEFENVMIDLRLQYGVFRPNANVVTMTSDTKSRPRRTGGLTAYFRRSGTAATESTKGWDSVELVAKLCSVLTKYENELSDDAAINIGDDLVSEIAYAFAAKEDDCGFNGDGSSTYDGIVGVRNKLLNLHATRANIAGLQVASGNLWSEIVIGDLLGVVGKLPQFARRAGNIKWYCSSEFWANVLQRLALAAGGATHAEYEGELKESFLGKPVEICESMPHVEANDVVPLLYGNLAQAAMFGDRKGTSIEMTNSDGSDFGSGIMAIRGDTRFDINVHDVGNAHATAASRTPGPIVGLLTAAS